MNFNNIGMASAVLLTLIVGASLYTLYVSPALLQRCLFRPYYFLRNREYSTLVTSAFVHADLPHLLFNCVTFWFFGLPLERIMGTPRFAMLYAVGLVFSELGPYLKRRNDPSYATLGASGAICAVLFASIVYMPDASLMILPIPIPIPAPLYAAGYLGYSWWASRSNRDGINHDAHFGGAITGLVFVALTDPDAYRRAAAMLGL
ncbi:MAG: rhomboid family intramembrane serine protease [Steroidobacteraceae bacterium]